MGGNGIRLVAKYLYDHGICRETAMCIETVSGIRELTLYTRNGRVSSVSVDMGKPDLRTECVPCTLPVKKAVN